MAKFILIMFICSGVPGNDCKTMPTPIIEFKTYYECAIYGYEFSTELLKEFSPDFVDQYRAYTAFDCKENQSI
mgnify:FL=1